MRLTTKIHLFTTVLFTVLLIVFSLAIYFSFSRLTYNSQLEEARNDLERTAREVDSVQNQAEAESLFRAYVPVNGMLRVVLPDNRVEVSVASGEVDYLREENAEFSRESASEVIDIDGEPHAKASIPIIWTGGEVVVLERYERLSSVAENLSTLAVVLVIVSVSALIPLYFSAKWIGRVIVRPITSLIQTMRRIRHSGRFELIETKGKSKDELQEMAETFNSMMERLKDNYEKQEQFVANASHELKTPLTVIDSYAGLLKRRGLEGEELFRESVDAIHEEAGRMYELTQQLLLLARHEDQLKVDFESVELNELLKKSAGVFEKGYNRRIDFHPADEKIILETDEQKVKQIVFILLDNARKYSEDAIEVKVHRSGDRALIEVTDYGIGMTQEQIARVFDRFYQADEARTDGFGLGMSLAKELARVLEGTMEIDSVKGNGTTVRLSLPVSQ
ncbi:sensor histidine kinase [Salimicrobium halophilum]|uniref:histidine kinase n=1 Tax=Salimicrobium halophilum TaxID=86666 RepID=A0A1G8S6A2_9BACI|nr:HAMP domain-containing sensor histidine kinase [Salimicrobium halophilum]SDJ24764.1 Signal transduction histidine kinase [Salimicrobium halophilum]